MDPAPPERRRRAASGEDGALSPFTVQSFPVRLLKPVQVSSAQPALPPIVAQLQESAWKNAPRVLFNVTQDGIEVEAQDSTLQWVSKESVSFCASVMEEQIFAMVTFDRTIKQFYCHMYIADAPGVADAITHCVMDAFCRPPPGPPKAPRRNRSRASSNVSRASSGTTSQSHSRRSSGPIVRTLTAQSSATSLFTTGLRCMVCDAASIVGSNFCSECGTQLVDEIDFEAPAMPSRR